MKRRRLLVAGGAGFFLAAAQAFSQAPQRRRIAFLSPARQGGRGLEIIRDTLKELGYVEGLDHSLEVRWAENRPERLPALAAELVKLKPEVILTASSAGVAACQKATSSIPIVFATAGRPVEQGFVSSLQRPGGNTTGIMLHDLMPKTVEAAKEVFPAIQRLAILLHETDQIQGLILDSFLRSAARFNVEPVVVRVRQASEFPRAFREVAERRAGALLLADVALNRSNAGELATRAIQTRVPLLSPFQETADVGGLLTYATSVEENFRRAALLADKILKGAKPSELPIEQPERFQLTVNRKTAKLIGVDLPTTIILRADRVIE